MARFKQYFGILGFSLLAFGSAQAAETGEFNFTGSIMADSCIVSLNTQNVELGRISKSSIAAAGTNSPKVPFSIDLNSCDPGQSILLKLSANAVDGETDIIRITGAATGVGVGVWETGAGSRLAIGQYSTTKMADPSGLVSYPFEAAYVSLGTVTPGAANAHATFEVIYP